LPSSFHIGQIVGDYEVVGVIGAGGMGSVYKVRNVISDRCDAMKVLLPDLRDSAELAERFLNEIKVLAGLSHPNIASLYTALRVDNQLLMVMELVDGVTLEERIGSGAVPVGQGLIYIAQILSALSYAHQRGVIHRDIKPANMAIHSDGRVKLLDFGIARANREQHFTQAGMVLGSLHYMSPEQIAGKQADARSDLYSVGVTLYRMATGKRPFDGDNALAIMRAQSETAPIPPHQINPALPETISGAILRSLAKVPGERFQTADEFRRALDGAFSTDSVETVLLSATSTPSSSSRFHGAVLSVLQKNLGVALGPIAGALVRKHSRSSETVGKLCTALAGQISAEEDRRAFLISCEKELGLAILSDTQSGLSQREATPAPRKETTAWEPAVLDSARRNLAKFIGPLAGVVVSRAARKAENLNELYSLLSAEIKSEKDRAEFLALSGRHSD
jgi:eukaryotic-like serine/threonine-protein kinase